MAFISVYFYLFLAALLALYYVLPPKYRWTALLLGSLGFYFVMDPQGFPLLLIAAALSYGAAMLLSHLKAQPRTHTGVLPGTQKKQERTSSNLTAQRIVLFCGIASVAVPLLVIKEGNFIATDFLHREPTDYIVPLGIAFYSLQIIAYLVDLYKGKIECQKNPAKYLLFISFFPQIVQGPIPRYERMTQLFEPHLFDEDKFTKGLHLILWGFFLKLMIADKAAVIVNTVFEAFEMYQGWYVLLAGILYSFQLYTDFQACVCIAKGVSSLFGIQLADNFRHPYFSESIKEFWQRWHLSLSSWLRDYIYIPLGGNRKGTVRKYINLFLTFIVSGMWHGAGYKYVFWGLMHAGYQLVGGLIEPLRAKWYALLRIERDSAFAHIARKIFTFVLVMFTWIIFRANSLHEGIAMVLSVFTVWNPWVVFSDKLFTLGLDWKDCMVLVASLLILLRVSLAERSGSVSERISSQHIIVRWGLYVAVVIGIMVFGSYGFGFNAQEFIYGGF